MKLLVLSSRPPWPATRADQLTVDRTIRFLVGRGHRVDLACLVASESESETLRAEYSGLCDVHPVLLAPWRSYLGAARSALSGLPLQVGYFHSPEMARTVDRLASAGDHDLVYAHLIRTSEYARALAMPRVLGMQISQGLNEARIADNMADPARGAFHRLESRLCQKYEQAVVSDFDRVLLVGQRDVDELERDGPVPNLLVRPHGQDLPAPRTTAPSREPGLIVFVGMMGSVTNVDAASWMATEVLPLVQRAHPGARLAIVGREPSAKARALSDLPGVEVTGEVVDVYDWLLRASVAVAPMRMAAGMQNKLVQSLASGAATVATSMANEGIGAEDGVGLLVRDDAGDFAGAVIDLLGDAGRAAALGKAGSDFVRARWTWDFHFEALEETLREVAEGSSAAGALRA